MNTIDILYRIIEFGLAGAGSTAVVLVFLRNLKVNTEDNLRRAAEAWQQIYSTINVQVVQLREELVASQLKIIEKDDVILNQRTALAKLTIAYEKECKKSKIGEKIA